jgi:serine protease Do
VQPAAAVPTPMAALPDFSDLAAKQGPVVVEDVAGPAARAGVRPGDVILSVNNTPVKSVGQLRELIARSGKSAALLVQRDDARIFIPVTVG